MRYKTRFARPGLDLEHVAGAEEGHQDEGPHAQVEAGDDDLEPGDSWGRYEGRAGMSLWEGVFALLCHGSWSAPSRLLRSQCPRGPHGRTRPLLAGLRGPPRGAPRKKRTRHASPDPPIPLSLPHLCAHSSRRPSVALTRPLGTRGFGIRSRAPIPSPLTRPAAHGGCRIGGWRRVPGVVGRRYGPRRNPTPRAAALARRWNGVRTA